MSSVSRMVMQKFYRKAEGQPEKLPWHREEPGRMLVEAVQARSGKGRALDLGCGGGVFSAWLAAQGLSNADRWLAFAGGAPLRALEYAKGERGETIERVLRAFASEDRAALADVGRREDLEPLAEVLQKLALDRAFVALAGRSRYGGSGKSAATDARAWLRYARAMGRRRLLTRHPLNPRLLAAEMVADMPGS